MKPIILALNLTLWIVLAFPIFSIGQTVVKLYPIADAPFGFHDNYDSEDNNYGTSDYYGAFYQPGASGGINGARSAMNFDLSVIPSGTVIISAKLNLFGRGAVSAGDATSVGNIGDNACYLQRVTSSWDELQVTWNTKPVSTTVNEVILPKSMAVIQDYPDINVTRLVQDMVDDPSGSYGFLIRLINEKITRGLFFCSRYYFDSNKYPELIITYGCSGASNINLNAGPDTTISAGNSVQLHASGAFRYNWLCDNTLNNCNISGPLATPVNSIVYYLNAVDSNGCVAKDSVFVNVLSVNVADSNNIVSLPNAFSPNNDGLNDHFKIPSPVKISLEEFSVFNRWGQKIFSSNDLNGWDGKMPGGWDAPMGVYSYYVRYLYRSKEEILKGNVTLLR